VRELTADRGADLRHLLDHEDDVEATVMHEPDTGAELRALAIPVRARGDALQALQQRPPIGELMLAAHRRRDQAISSLSCCAAHGVIRIS
jgi:hypothetical protein